MKELITFRIFALFPFIGILVPDLATALSSSLSAIPASHVIVEITLAVCLVICSGGIFMDEANVIKLNPAH